ncbi:MAG TPA: HAD family hydrolase [Caldilineaceae bacterium]|nr:HAD family hydrolase [Caldilineaceae bacterium]
MTLRAVIFDRDGVLTDFDLVKATHFFAPRVPLSLWELSDRWEAWGRQVGFPRSPAEEAAFFRGLWDSLCDELRLAPTVRADLHSFDYTTCLTPYPDARPALEAARAAGLRIGVLSNFSLASLEASLAATGLASLVDVACAATVIGAAKPAPEAYRIAAGRLGVQPEECLFFDDEELCVAGARRVGMAAYRVDRKRQAHDLAAGIVAGLSAVPQLIQTAG